MPTIKSAFIGILLLGITFMLLTFVRTNNLKRTDSETDNESTFDTRMRSAAKRVKKSSSQKQDGVNFDVRRSVKVIRGKSITSVVKRDKIKYLKVPYLGRKGVRLSENCSKEKNWKMVIFVKSTVKGSKRRSLIRRTWGSVRSAGNSSFHVVFVIGRNDNQPKKTLNKEYKKHQDILQIDAPDDYGNVVLKTLAGLQWASENLDDKDFFSNTDDDMLIDLWQVDEMIGKYQRLVEEEDWPEFPAVCMYQLWENSGMPYRDPNNKYYISKTRYKWPLWPKFCTGGMYSLNIKVVRQLWEASRTSDIIHLEDVWTTGILREKIGMPKEMLVPVSPPAAVHYGGFEYDKTAKDFLQDWRKTYKNHTHNSTCWYKPSKNVSPSLSQKA